MQTLYEVLGALPSDDAEGLRAAFRKAVKGAHPDIHPNDPDAAIKFRQIVRANEILVDDVQRAAYDHLLDLARLEQDSASRHAIAAKVHKVATGVIAFACVSVVTLGGYLLYLHISAAVVPPPNKMETALRAWAKIAAVRPVVSPDTVGNSASAAKPEHARVAVEAVAPVAAVPEADQGGVAAFNASATPDANSLQAPGVLASRNGDRSDASAELEQAIDLEPTSSSPAYMDRGMVFYRLRKFDRAFADIARARQIQNTSHARSASTMAGKSRLSQAVMVPAAPPLPRPRPRPSMHDPSRDEAFASAMR